MVKQLFLRQEIQAWEQRWFTQQNSAYGLMQQVAWILHLRFIQIFKQYAKPIHKIAICCGQGNNAGDGFLTAKYLKQAGYHVDIYTAACGTSKELAQAYLEVQAEQIRIIQEFNFEQNYDCYIDALFGIGLNRLLDQYWQSIIYSINQQQALKLSIDIPSGLNADTGQPLPCAVKADYSFSVLAFKIGLFTGQAQEYVGKVELIDVIPPDEFLTPVAKLSPHTIHLPVRKAFGHKGSYGHVLIVGGHMQMGGAVIMAAEAASHAGAGKVTVVCHAKHHTAILTRAPNLMLRDIDALSDDEIAALITQVDAVSFGMGLGRDEWAEYHYKRWSNQLNQSKVELVYDADALWFLAEYPIALKANCYATPHPGEAARLLELSVSEIEEDRVASIYSLQQRYAGQWVLKGSGSLSLHKELWVCTAGNPGMGTAGMGDILAGMIAGLKAQFHDQIQLHQIVTLHALAGDLLAQQGQQGLQAQHMTQALYRVLNLNIDQRC